jgi:hypothetical protein
MSVEIKGSKVWRDGVVVGVVWPFGGAWFSRVFAESSEIGSRKFHLQENALADARARAEALTAADVSLMPSRIIPKLDRPEAFSD